MLFKISPLKLEFFHKEPSAGGITCHFYSKRGLSGVKLGKKHCSTFLGFSCLASHYFSMIIKLEFFIFFSGYGVMNSIERSTNQETRLSWLFRAFHQGDGQEYGDLNMNIIDYQIV